MDTIAELVYNYKTKSEYGFIKSEYDELLKKFPSINMERFNNALSGITCMIDEETKDSIIYPIDIYHALVSANEDGELTIEEWD
jgi:hypothetical protein